MSGPRHHHLQMPPSGRPHGQALRVLMADLLFLNPTFCCRFRAAPGGRGCRRGWGSVALANRSVPAV